MPVWAISGGGGFLGLHLVPRLLADGIGVRSLDLVRLDPELVRAGAVDLRGDVRNAKEAFELCAGTDVLVHAAAALPSRRSVEAIRSVNVAGTATLLAAAAEAGVRRAIVLSSAVVYGLPESLPLTEASWTAPIEPYGRSKVEAERVVHEFAVRGLATVVLRPQAFIGPGRLGVFGILFDWVAEGRRIYTLGSGRNRYQLLAVEDLVTAILLAAERPVAGETYNLGARQFGTVAEDLAGLVAHAGSASRVTALPAELARIGLRGLALAGLSPLAEWHYRTADRDVYCDVSKAERDLGWAPRRSNLDALSSAYDWHFAHRDERPAGGLTHRERWSERALGLVRRVS
jgi:nucleoside-diphosphate-sugar epimerase